MGREIGISLQGDAIPFDTFLKAAGDLQGLLRELEKEISGGHCCIDWAISLLSTGSAVVAVSPSVGADDAIDNSDLVISSALAGLEAIELAPTRPPHFSDAALTRAKGLAGVVNGHVSWVSLFGASGNNHRPASRIRITQRVAANVDELIGVREIALGSVEGTLETLSIHGANTFNVYDALTHRPIRCVASRDDVLQLQGQLGKRVLVAGEIRANASGEPLSINVETFRVLRSRDELPQGSDLLGLFADDPIDAESLSALLRE